MRFKITLGLVALFQCAFAQDGAPAAPYYNNFNFQQTGTPLKNALATKISNTHTHQLTYSQIWDALERVDVDPTNTSNVLLLYGWEAGSDNDVTNDRSRDKFDHGGSNGQWNREHTFVQSAGNPALGQTGPGADAHHLRACDVQRNNNRGNQLFATGSGQASSAVTGGWYPGDEWKGDVARMIMYMYLRYGEQCLPTNIGTGATVSTDANMLQLFLQWNADDPVSPYEDYRNTYLGNANNTYGQGNRNPFIDNPYLATMIWGGPVAQNRWPNLSTTDVAWTQTVSVYPNPTRDIVHISSESQIDRILVYSTNGQLVKVIENPASAGDVYEFNGLGQGFYLLQIQSGDSNLVKKLIVE